MASFTLLGRPERIRGVQTYMRSTYQISAQQRVIQMGTKNNSQATISNEYGTFWRHTLTSIVLPCEFNSQPPMGPLESNGTEG